MATVLHASPISIDERGHMDSRLTGICVARRFLLSQLETMRHRDRIIEYVNRFPGRDDDELSKALQIYPRQTVNMECRKLEADGLIERRPCRSGKLANYPGGATPILDKRTVAVSNASSPDSANATDDWFWEGNVTDAVAAYLKATGWTILSQADTRSRARGVDLHASKENGEIVIEVKGYPSKVYRDARKMGQPKATNPTLQARHWYAQALLKAIKLQSMFANAQAVIAVPDFPRYRTLIEETRPALHKLGIGLLIAAETGEIEADGLIA